MSKSRTFNVSVERLFNAFADDHVRRQWLDVEITVRSTTAPKRMRIVWDDATPVQLAFTAKGPTKSMLAVQHEKLPDRSAADAVKKAWSGHLDRLEELLFA